MPARVEAINGNRVGTPAGRSAALTGVRSGRYDPTRPPRLRIPLAGSRRLAGLDLLRLGAAIAVVLFHFCYRGTAGQGLSQVAYPEIAGLAKYGFLGVDLFFMISGFVIAASAEGRTALRFGLARFARLYPAHVACMTATALVIALWGMPPHAATFGQWLANLTMLAPALGQPFMDGAYWSIVLEIVFYGWVGLLLALGVLERRLLTIVAVWLAVCALNSAVLHVKALNVVLLTEYGPLFASGILMHRLWRNGSSPAVWALLTVAAGLGFGHAFEIRAGFSKLYGDTIDITTLWLLHAGLYAVFGAALVVSRHIVPTPRVLALGGLTYPLYLLHQNAGYIGLTRLEPVVGRWPALTLVVMLVLAAAWVIWRFVEPQGRRALDALFGAAQRSLAGWSRAGAMRGSRLVARS